MLEGWNLTGIQALVSQHWTMLHHLELVVCRVPGTWSPVAWLGHEILLICLHLGMQAPAYTVTMPGPGPQVSGVPGHSQASVGNIITQALPATY